MNYIIVQAGGRGTRLEYLTRNKPKALVPVNNLPMLFHLFRKYQDKHFIIIADYKKEVMKEYLQVFADVKYQIVEARGNGTCAGIKQAIHLLPEKEPFLLIWSDLLLPMDLKLPSGYEDGEYSNPTEDYIGISQSFPCRWSYFAGRFEEKKSYDHGVAGFFLFTDKEKIKAVPENGELVRWMQKSKLKFCEIGLDGTKEFGLLEEYSRLEQNKCRPFNRITIRADRFIKEAVDKHGRKLAKREREWYKKAGELGITALPKIYGTEPLEMELIQGKNIYEYQLSYEEKKKVLKKLVETLQILHSKEQVPADLSACREVYLNKTFYRVDKIRNLLPFANEKILWLMEKDAGMYFFI
ncbi:nucleotidyltransferase family protein [Sporofaciens musculi]|uniref:nucleotidyltransferase family protein n=1 Tax=Sporofaciens musculi TaxID=2681861 RepID=UPI001FCBC574|nr:NDP-sugar synthase [Sporofaciens musculi]